MPTPVKDGAEGREEWWSGVVVSRAGRGVGKAPPHQAPSIENRLTHHVLRFTFYVLRITQTSRASLKLTAR